MSWKGSCRSPTRSSYSITARRSPRGCPTKSSTTNGSSRPISVRNTMLSVENLQLKYGKIPVIHDVSLKVDRGEIVAIVGGNGNGKSSILKGIAGVVQPAAGTVTFEGKNISKLESYDIVSLGISLVPEGRRLF